MLKKIFLLYLALVAASHITIAFQNLPAIPSGQSRIGIGSGVSVAYVDSAPQDTEKPVALLIHGSPVDVALFNPLIADLKRDFRVIAPVLPGFGASTRTIPDYSIAAHARYVAEFCARLGLKAVHLVGYSMGAGVAVELAHRQPLNFSSLTLLSGIGAQEHELLGNYHLNHMLHGLQLGLLWSLHHLLPHFGGFDNFPLNYYYARNFFDTDQRPLKSYLASIRLPVLILHGRQDMLVPVAAARLHHELVPQSELRIFPDDGHLVLWEKPDMVAAALRNFIDQVEAAGPDMQRAVSIAATERQRMALQSVKTEKATGFALVFLLLLIALTTFASEDLSAIAAGILAANGNISLLEATAAAFAGIFTGDILLLLLGRLLRSRTWVDRWLKKFVPAQALSQSLFWLQAKGIRAVFISRFIPGTRLPLYLALGYSGQGMLRFVGAFCLACLVWTPLIVGAGYLFGEEALSYLEKYNASVWLAVFAGAVAGWAFKKILVPLATWKGRRLLYSAWLRLTHWEFWPPWIFYIPLGFYFIFMIIRYRSFTVFTAANPAIPDGGVIGESKAAILHGLSRAGKNIARFTLIDPAPAGERMLHMSDFMRRQKLKFPVVLKPDVGERGNDVQIIHSRTAAVGYFEQHTKAVIVQEYIAGIEFGVFYFRFPQSHRGEIFAITDKRFPAVTGDGARNLEQLILSDRRAVTMARFHLRKFAERLGEVIPAGESFSLVELGTHCKGSLFLDGMQYLTPQLAQAIELISRNFDGFFFGRYDIRVPSLADFQSGKNLKVVELNGVTSEATSIYDPKHSLTHAYKILARQWQIAFAIGAANAAQGAFVTPLSVLVPRLFAKP